MSRTDAGTVAPGSGTEIKCFGGPGLRPPNSNSSQTASSKYHALQSESVASMRVCITSDARLASNTMSRPHIQLLTTCAPSCHGFRPSPKCSLLLQICNLSSQPPDLFCWVLDVHWNRWAPFGVGSGDTACFVSQPLETLQCLLQKLLFACEIGLNLDLCPRLWTNFRIESNLFCNG